MKYEKVYNTLIIKFNCTIIIDSNNESSFDFETINQRNFSLKLNLDCDLHTTFLVIFGKTFHRMKRISIEYPGLDFFDFPHSLCRIVLMHPIVSCVIECAAYNL